MLVVLGASYDSVSDAEVDFEAVKAMYNNAGVGHDFDAAIVERGEDGRVKVAKKHEESTRHGAWKGLAIGALTAVLPGVGLGVAAAVGASVEDVLEAMEATAVYEAASLDAPRPSSGEEGTWTYADQLAATAARVAEHVGLNEWHLAYQSVSAAAREPWLGPSVEQVMDRLAADGATEVLVDPIGFISDHVETLYDNDIEHRAHAEAVGLAFYRCRCLNDHPGLIDTLVDLVIATSDRG